MFRPLLRIALLPVLLLPLFALGDAPPTARAEASVAASSAPTAPEWSWPLLSPRVVRPYVQPPHAYGPGHRGIDVRGADLTVRAPDDGVVVFVGVVVDRPVLTIDHGDGLVSSVEPVTTMLRPGDAVTRGEQVGTIAPGGHAPAETLHLGARIEGAYVNPLLLLGTLPPAVLLPCC